MTRLDALRNLRSKVEAGESEGVYRAADMAFPIPASNELFARCFEAFHGSTDAALAFHGAVLPGWMWSLHQDQGASINNRELAWSEKFKGDWMGFSARCQGNPARALLCCDLDALIAQEEAEGVA